MLCKRAAENVEYLMKSCLVYIRKAVTRSAMQMCLLLLSQCSCQFRMKHKYCFNSQSLCSLSSIRVWKSLWGGEVNGTVSSGQPSSVGCQKSNESLRSHQICIVPWRPEVTGSSQTPLSGSFICITDRASSLIKKSAPPPLTAPSLTCLVFPSARADPGPVGRVPANQHRWERIRLQRCINSWINNSSAAASEGWMKVGHRRCGCVTGGLWNPARTDLWDVGSYPRLPLSPLSVSILGFGDIPGVWGAFSL